MNARISPSNGQCRATEMSVSEVGRLQWAHNAVSLPKKGSVQGIKKS
jgi:hypothetical protein